VSDNRLEARLAELVRAGECGLAPYITAGDGGLARTRAVLEGLEAAGAACVELGVPFSDPIADGPVLQSAAQRALQDGTTLDGVLAMLADYRAAGGELPVAIFSYANPLVRRGWSRSMDSLRAAGADGVLVPDLPVEEGGALADSAGAQGLCPIFFVTPTTSDERVRAAAEASRGFLYAIGRAGVTGDATKIDSSTLAYLARIRAHTALPIALGFGLCTPGHVAAIAAHVDLAVVGSALVRRIHEAALAGTDPAAAAASFITDLANGASR